MDRRAMSNPVRFLGIALVKSADLTRHRRFINHKDQGPYLATHGSIQYTAINQSIDRPIDSSSHAKRRTNQVEVELARARRGRVSRWEGGPRSPALARAVLFSLERPAGPFGRIGGCVGMWVCFCRGLCAPNSQDGRGRGSRVAPAPLGRMDDDNTRACLLLLLLVLKQSRLSPISTWLALMYRSTDQ